MGLLATACTEHPDIEIDAEIAGGSGQLVAIEPGERIVFSLNPDPVGNERLWFHFRVRSTSPVQPEFVISNSGEAHQHNWDVVEPVFSIDGTQWIRATETWPVTGRPVISRIYDRIAGRAQGFRFRAPFRAMEFLVAYTIPYGEIDLDRFMARVVEDQRVSRSVFGRSATGRPLHLLTVEGDRTRSGVERPEIWLVAREHPGETPASLVLEGFVDTLLQTAEGKHLLDAYRFEIVPMLNIDGVQDGRYYRSPAGIDLAQDWTQFRSPETTALHASMIESLEGKRVALVINLHSANSPKSHFFLETPAGRLPESLAALQRRLLQSADGVNAQLQVTETVALWDYPEIFGNFLASRHQVYCLYLESNYSIGADGSKVTAESLHRLGADLLRSIEVAMLEGGSPIQESGN